MFYKTKKKGKIINYPNPDKHHTRKVGELRFINLAGPEELTPQALSPKQRGYRVFIDRLEWATLAANRLV